MKGARSLMNDTVSESGAGSGLGKVVSFCKSKVISQIDLDNNVVSGVTHLHLTLRILGSIRRRRRRRRRRKASLNW